MKKKLFKITFVNGEKESMTIHASSVNPSSFLGLIEVSDIVFMDSSDILVTPGDDKIKTEFKNVERTFLPINTIIRIDEVYIEKETPIIRLYNGDDD
ncbi:DUF1820 family protein [Limisalsivibrio acetivorans]|uniref:DUF1820 family protein n=1 Tax=Limisalsivibrio acetivorans TaxID=1304888 RepID=UPI0003B7B16F|nr:DUF1820 family protein [Limisalsivibrio acetivorans]